MAVHRRRLSSMSDVVQSVFENDPDRELLRKLAKQYDQDPNSVSSHDYNLLVSLKNLSKSMEKLKTAKDDLYSENYSATQASTDERRKKFIDSLTAFEDAGKIEKVRKKPVENSIEPPVSQPVKNSYFDAVREAKAKAAPEKEANQAAKLAAKQVESPVVPQENIVEQAAVAKPQASVIDRYKPPEPKEASKGTRVTSMSSTTFDFDLHEAVDRAIANDPKFRDALDEAPEPISEDDTDDLVTEYGNLDGIDSPSKADEPEPETIYVDIDELLRAAAEENSDELPMERVAYDANLQTPSQISELTDFRQQASSSSANDFQAKLQGLQQGKAAQSAAVANVDDDNDAVVSRRPS